MPNEETQWDLVNYYHSEIVSHGSPVQCMRQLQKSFVFDGMYKMCEKAYKHCSQCQRNVPRTARPYLNMQRFDKPREHGVSYSMDLLVGLPPTGPMSRPYDAILVVVDRFSKTQRLCTAPRASAISPGLRKPPQPPEAIFTRESQLPAAKTLEREHDS